MIIKSSLTWYVLHLTNCFRLHTSKKLKKSNLSSPRHLRSSKSTPRAKLVFFAPQVNPQLRSVPQSIARTNVLSSRRSKLPVISLSTAKTISMAPKLR